MTDERLLTAAKLRAQITGDMEGDKRLLDHAGLLVGERDHPVLSFLSTGDDGWHGSDLERTISSSLVSSAATRAIEEGNSDALARITGITEQDLDASSLTLPLRLLEQIENNDAPAFILGAGNPNTGKTNTMSLLAELRSLDPRLDDYLIISNSRTWPLSDIVVTSAHDLAVTLLEHRETPKFVFIDEGSTHFDARTYSREVATQWTPLAKRFAKIGVDACGIVIHTGKDCHPEAKRLTTLAYYKIQKTVAEFYSTWPADGDSPTGRLFGGDLTGLQPATAEPDPDDSAPWAWDLESDLFSRDLDWPDLLDALRRIGPAQS